MNKFVNLPEINQVEIANFNLYKNGIFKFNFTKAFNLFLGINGLGKTTTLKLIAYGLVGFIDQNSNEKNISKIEIREFTEIKEYGINRKGYFKRYENQTNSTIYLEFKLGENIFKIKRNILKHSIIELTINENKFENNLDEIYNQYFEEYSGMTLDNFINILYTLLIRFEEAPSLLFRPRTQHMALRTLILHNNVHKEFIEAERRYRVAESNYRSAKYDLTTIRQKINYAVEELNDINEKLQDTADINSNKIDTIEQDIQLIDKEISIIDTKFNNHKQLIDEAIAEKEKLVIEKEKLENQLDNISDEILKLQEDFYVSVYSDSEVYNLAINSLNLRNRCTFCDSQVDEPRKTILEKSINHGICPFCDTNLSNNSVSNVNLEDLNKLNSDKNKIVKLKSVIENNIAKINKEIYSFDSDLKNFLSDKANLIKSHKDSSNLLLEQNYNSSKDLSTKIAINRKEKDDLESNINMYKYEFSEKSREVFGIEVDYNIFEQNYYLNGENSGLEQDFYLAEKEYNNLKIEVAENIKKLEKDIIDKFQKYNILKDEFNLMEIETNKLEQNIDVKYNIFVPVEIESNNKRTDETKLSKSEQILLDYAFRLALIELYSEISNNKKTFIAFESSEGVLDMKNIKEFTKMLKKYSENNMLLLISNFNNTEYLITLMNKFFENKLNQLLNFIDISSKDVDRKFYSDLWNRIVNRGEN